MPAMAEGGGDEGCVPVCISHQSLSARRRRGVESAHGWLESTAVAKGLLDRSLFFP